MYTFSVVANPHSTLVVKDYTGATVQTLNGGTSGSGITQIPVRSDLSEAERTFTCTMSAEYGYVPYWNNDPTDDDTTIPKTVIVSDNTASISTSADELYTLTVNAGTGGTVSNVAITGTNASTVTQSGNTYTVRASKASGVTFTLTATPDTNYNFTNWTNAGSAVLSTDNPYSFSISNTMTATANFVEGKTIDITDSDAKSCWALWAWESGQSGTAIIIADTKTQHATGIIDNKYDYCHVFRIDPAKIGNISSSSSWNDLKNASWNYYTTNIDISSATGLSVVYGSGNWTISTT